MLNCFRTVVNKELEQQREILENKQSKVGLNGLWGLDRAADVTALATSTQYPRLASAIILIIILLFLLLFNFKVDELFNSTFGIARCNPVFSSIP